MNSAYILSFLSARGGILKLTCGHVAPGVGSPALPAADRNGGFGLEFGASQVKIDDHIRRMEAAQKRFGTSECSRWCAQDGVVESTWPHSLNPWEVPLWLLHSMGKVSLARGILHPSDHSLSLSGLISS